MDKRFIDDYYSTRVSQSDDRLYQVGKTVNGQVVGKESLSIIAKRVVDGLHLTLADSVTDMGCGNGLLTEQIAPYVREIVAVDRSRKLLDIARSVAPSNVSYVQGDILDIGEPCLREKAFSYEVMQHLTHRELGRLLQERLVREPTRILLGGILDAAKVMDYFRTSSQRQRYFSSLESGASTELGTWWHREHICDLARRSGFRAYILDQDPQLYTSYYRFDAILDRI